MLYPSAVLARARESRKIDFPIGTGAWWRGRIRFPPRWRADTDLRAGRADGDITDDVDAELSGVPL